MKETIRNLAKALRQSNRAYECLIQFGNQCLNHFVPLSGSIENPLHRTLLDQFRSQCSIQLYENEKLIFVATKLISEPELMDRPEVTPYLAQLGAVDSSLNDGLYGRPILGFLHPIISESVIDLIHQSSDCSSWEEWKNSKPLDSPPFKSLMRGHNVPETARNIKVWQPPLPDHLVIYLQGY